jgi:PAS domain S-box-containing protein
MDRDPAESTQIPIDRQISRLSQLAEQIQVSLIDADQTDVESILDDLAQLSHALANASQQVAKQTEEHANYLALANINQLLNSSLQVNDVLRVVMDTIVRITGAERGFLMLKDEHERLSIHIARNWERESLDDADAELSRTVVNQVIEDGQPVLTTNAQQDPRFDDQESIISLNLRSILCVPLILKNTTIGVIYADNRLREGLFTETEKNLLAAFANQAAVAIENARLFESVRSSLAEVTELKNLMDDVFASIASGVLTTDLDQHITLSNSVAEQLLDQSQRDLNGKKGSQVPIFKAINLQSYLTRVCQSNQQMRGLQFKLQITQGDQLYLRFNLAPLIDANNDILGTAIVMEDVTETRRLEAQRRLFERMVAPAVIDQLNPDALNLGGTRAFITTIFADIRGYTSVSERCDPETLVSVLNRYLGAAAEAILAEQGTIDKFMGDAIMAFFNAPISQEDHALRAVRAAVEMRSAINSIQGELPAELRLGIGIGVHSGEAVLGLVGTQERLEYTAIGDSVNTAKRLQENAAPGQILISAATFAKIADSVLAHAIKPIKAKGKSDLIEVFEVSGLNSNFPAHPP